MHAEIDHLVIAAARLDEGVQWCEAALGVTPGAGGAHPLMGTHNRLLTLAGAGFPRCYLEIIAIDPGQRPARGAGQRRWFDLDDPALQADLAANGPRLVHLAARVPDAHAAVRALAAEPLRIDRGEVLQASRETPAGRLEWQITVRDDGRRLFDGALPTLIQWGPVHPADAMPASGITLTDLGASHPRADELRTALATIGLSHAIEVFAGAPNLIATLETPRGRVVLASKGH